MGNVKLKKLSQNKTLNLVSQRNFEFSKFSGRDGIFAARF